MKRNSNKINTDPVPRCVTGKKKSSYSQARREAKYMKYNKKYPNAVPAAYKCKSCGWWHVGNLVR